MSAEINLECPRGCPRPVWVEVETDHDGEQYVVTFSDEALFRAYRRHRCRFAGRRPPTARFDRTRPGSRRDMVYGPED